MITLRKINHCVTESDGLIMRGTPTKITGEWITFKITHTVGVQSGIRYRAWDGRKITCHVTNVDTFR